MIPVCYQVLDELPYLEVGAGTAVCCISGTWYPGRWYSVLRVRMCLSSSVMYHVIQQQYHINHVHTIVPEGHRERTRNQPKILREVCERGGPSAGSISLVTWCRYSGDLHTQQQQHMEPGTCCLVASWYVPGTWYINRQAQNSTKRAQAARGDR